MTPPDQLPESGVSASPVDARPVLAHGQTALVLQALALGTSFLLGLSFLIHWGEEHDAILAVGGSAIMILACWSFVLAVRELWRRPTRMATVAAMLLPAELAVIGTGLWWWMDVRFLIDDDPILKPLLMYGGPVILPFLGLGAFFATPLAAWLARKCQQRRRVWFFGGFALGLLFFIIPTLPVASIYCAATGEYFEDDMGWSGRPRLPKQRPSDWRFRLVRKLPSWAYDCGLRMLDPSGKGTLTGSQERMFERMLGLGLCSKEKALAYLSTPKIDAALLGLRNLDFDEYINQIDLGARGKLPSPIADVHGYYYGNFAGRERLKSLFDFNSGAQPGFLANAANTMQRDDIRLLWREIMFWTTKGGLYRNYFLQALHKHAPEAHRVEIWSYLLIQSDSTLHEAMAWCLSFSPESFDQVFMETCLFHSCPQVRERALVGLKEFIKQGTVPRIWLVMTMRKSALSDNVPDHQRLAALYQVAAVTLSNEKIEAARRVLSFGSPVLAAEERQEIGRIHEMAGNWLITQQTHDANE